MNDTNHLESNYIVVFCGIQSHTYIYIMCIWLVCPVPLVPFLRFIIHVPDENWQIVSMATATFTSPRNVNHDH